MSPIWPSMTSLKFLPHHHPSWKPPSVVEQGEPVSHFWTFCWKDIDFASTSHAGTALHLGRFLEPVYQDESPLGKLWMASCPHISWDACSALVGHTRDRLLWNRCEAAGDPQRVCGTCNTWNDLDQIWVLVLVPGFSLGLLFPFTFIFPRFHIPLSYLIFGCSQGEINDNMVEVSSSRLRRGTDSDEAIRSPQT